MPVTVSLGGGRQARVPGLDLARAMALFGMVVVNYALALGATGGGPGWLRALTGALQGRAAATFVVLAGVGVALGAARAADDRRLRSSERWRLARRGLALFALGTAFLSLWPADILHFYGAYFLLGAALLHASDRVLVGAGLAALGSSVVFLASGAWPERWDFTTLEYRGQWTASGFTRSLFLDGFHPVCPWFAFLVLGVLLGRHVVHDRVRRRRAGAFGLAIWAGTELLARWLAPQGIEAPGAAALAATTCFPPTPAYMVAAGGLATAWIAAAAEVGAWTPRGWPCRARRAVEATGRLALTLYVAHVVVGLGALEALGLARERSLPFAVGAATLFSVLSVAFSVAWSRRCEHGPLEGLLRRVLR